MRRKKELEAKMERILLRAGGDFVCALTDKFEGFDDSNDCK